MSSPRWVAGSVYDVVLAQLSQERAAREVEQRQWADASLAWNEHLERAEKSCNTLHAACEVQEKAAARYKAERDRLREALREIAQPGYGIDHESTTEEEARYWFTMSERQRERARAALNEGRAMNRDEYEKALQAEVVALRSALAECAEYLAEVLRGSGRAHDLKTTVDFSEEIGAALARAREALKGKGER